MVKRSGREYKDALDEGCYWSYFQQVEVLTVK